MNKRLKILALCSMISLVAQPLMAMQEFPTSPKKQQMKTIAVATGITAIAALVVYLLLAKSDDEVCASFTQEVRKKINQERVPLIMRQKCFTVQPISQWSSTAQPHQSDHTKTILSDNQIYAADIQHLITKKYGIRLHSITAHARPATQFENFYGEFIVL